MPRQSAAQITGDAGELWLQRQLPAAWLLQKPTRDVGVDGVVVICEEGALNGREFRVQVKTSKSFVARSTRDRVSLSVRFDTLDYWFRSPIPTMLVAVDLEADQGFYRWDVDLLPAILPRADQTPPPKTMTLDILLANRISPAAWPVIRDNLLNYYRNLSTHTGKLEVRVLSCRQSMPSLLPAAS